MDTTRECIYLLKGIMCRKPVAEGGLLLCEEHAGLLQRPELAAPPTAPRCPRCKSERSAHSVTWKDGTRTRRCESCSRLFAGPPVQREPAATPRRRLAP